MNNTNLGTAMGALLPSQTPSVDRTQKVEASTKVDNDGEAKDFKKSMASAEQSADTTADKALEKPIKEPIKEPKDKSAAVDESRGADAEIGVEDGNNASEMNAVKSSFFSEATSSEMISPELLAIDVRVGLSTLQEETVDSLISPLSMIGDSALIDPAAITPLGVKGLGELRLGEQELQIPELSELSYAVQQVLNPLSGTQKSETTAPHSLLMMSPSALPALGTSPIAQLMNKLSISNTVTSDLSEADFDISVALSKEIEKPLTSPLITPLTAKPSAELLPGQLSLNTSFQSAGQWSEAVTEKVMWMSSKGIKEATIQLDPPELGSLQVKVGVNQDQAQVSFTVQHASVREALDQQSMRLREMFAEDGLNLTDVDVSDQSSQDEPGEGAGEESGEARGNRFSQDGSAEQDDMLVTPLSSEARSYSLIDAYI